MDNVFHDNDVNGYAEGLYEKSIKQGELQDYIIELILDERHRQIRLAHGGNTDEFDKSNSENDWIAYIVAYAGRASRKVARNDRENQGFRENMIKVAALALAALEQDISLQPRHEPTEPVQGITAKPEGEHES